MGTIISSQYSLNMAELDKEIQKWLIQVPVGDILTLEWLCLLQVNATLMVGKLHVPEWVMWLSHLPAIMLELPL